MTEPRETTILNVDDNEAGRYATTRMLRKAGYRVLEAGTGTQVMATLESEPVDLVVLDVNLPDVNGLELCSRIKGDPRFQRLPVLHLTATYVMSVDRLQESQADGYLMQPVEPAALIANIRALTRAAETEKNLRQTISEWEAALNSLDEAICVLGPNREIIRTNTYFEEKAGEALAGPPTSEGEDGRPRRLRGLDELLQQKSVGGRTSAEVSVEGLSYEADLFAIKGAGRERARHVIVLRPTGRESG